MAVLIFETRVFSFFQITILFPQYYFDRYAENLRVYEKNRRGAWAAGSGWIQVKLASVTGNVDQFCPI